MNKVKPNEAFELYWNEQVRLMRPAEYSETEKEVARYYFQVGFLKSQESAPQSSEVLEVLEEVASWAEMGSNTNERYAREFFKNILVRVEAFLSRHREQEKAE